SLTLAGAAGSYACRSSHFLYSSFMQFPHGLKPFVSAPSLSAKNTRFLRNILLPDEHARRPYIFSRALPPYVIFPSAMRRLSSSFSTSVCRIISSPRRERLSQACGDFLQVSR